MGSEMCIRDSACRVLVAVTPDDDEDATRARERDQLVWDLHFGVEPAPSTVDVYDVVDDALLARIAELAAPSRHVVAGHDFYPVSVFVHGARDEPLTIAERVAAYDREARAWYGRYARPYWVAETSNLGLPVEEGPRWLGALVECIDRLRSDGFPARGICWYSRGDQFDWQTMLTRPVGAVTEVGLFDVDRRARPVAAAYAALADRWRDA